MNPKNPICPHCKVLPKATAGYCSPCNRLLKAQRAQRAKERRTDGICPRCCKAPREAGYSYCTPCKNEIYREQHAAKQAVTMCTACGKHSKAHRRSICLDCHRVKQRVSANSYTRRKRNSRADSNACNCGARGCSGLTCDVVSA